MNTYPEKLQAWLPAIQRIRDAEQGGPLRALLDILGTQADLMDADIARLYDNWFIETCDEWVVPYLGDLLGVRGLHGVSNATFSQRARVANTLRFRRRKGTAAMLEQLARDTTGWNARAVEFFQRLGTTQYLNHRRLQNLRTPDLRDANALELIDTPFDATARTADVRRIAIGRGKHNLPNIGLFLWRLQAYPVNRAPAFDHGQGRHGFSQLGNDLPLFNRPVTERDITHLAQEINVPAPIRRRAFHANKSAYYGGNLGIQIWEAGTPRAVEDIVPCNLTDWIHRPPPGKIAVDPALGRLAFPEGVTPGKIEVRYAYGFSADLGGGFYDREAAPEPADAHRYPVAKSLPRDTLQKAVADWTNDGKPNAIVLIQDSEFYDETMDLTLPAGRTLEIRAGTNPAGEQQRPVVRLSNAFTITGETPAQADIPGATLILDGLWIAGQHLQVQAGDLGALLLRHCTLVPGWSLNPDNTPVSPGQPSLRANGPNARLDVTLERCITSRLIVPGTRRLTVSDSIVAAEGHVAINGPTLVVRRCTILGSIRAEILELASNSIFTDRIEAIRRQEGCVRFCSLPTESRVPRRFRCQPTLALQEALETAKAEGRASLTAAEESTIESRLKPVFTSERYGTPAFAQLHAQGPREIYTGADNEAEIDAFNHLLQPQRETNLRSSLAEFLRAGLEAGFFFADQPI